MNLEGLATACRSTLDTRAPPSCATCSLLMYPRASIFSSRFCLSPPAALPGRSSLAARTAAERAFMAAKRSRIHWPMAAMRPGRLMFSIVSLTWKFSRMTATKRLETMRREKENHTSTKKHAKSCPMRVPWLSIALNRTDDQPSPVRSWKMVSRARGKVPKLDRVSSSMSVRKTYRPVTPKQSATMNMKRTRLRMAPTELTALLSSAMSVGR
mmetsp:Transcript_3217/g.8220  ORF Transcript_3217/g.8220 Transcript_3217/m.8220 type:complete len:212 (-) Transcript_3217:920-1555(-)